MTSLFDLEKQMLIKLGFDFEFPGPMPFIERYVRLLEHDHSVIVLELAFSVCKFTLVDIYFLQFQPSLVAACAVLIAVNIQMRDREKLLRIGSFAGSTKKATTAESSSFDMKSKFYISDRCDADGKKLLKLNTGIWSASVAKLTGYKLDELRKCLHRLCRFVSENLAPDRLKGFDVDELE